jgi:hypothetical protein
MDKQTQKGATGLILIGLGASLAAAGVALLVPVCASWSKNRFQRAYERGRRRVASGLDTAMDALNQVAERAHEPLGEAAKAARHTTAIAAGAIESAAHYVKERVQ